MTRPEILSPFQPALPRVPSTAPRSNAMRRLARRIGLLAAAVLLAAPVACTADSSSGGAEAWTPVEKAAPATPPANVPGSPLATESAREGRISYPVEGVVDLDLSDVRRRTREFMAHNREIELTAAQEQVKREALSALPAPCCSQYSAYTCCCECNLARTIWGLSNHLIADLEYDAGQVRDAVSTWVDAVNPAGFTGNACFVSGGCGRPFAGNGCGGMADGSVNWS